MDRSTARPWVGPSQRSDVRQALLRRTGFVAARPARSEDYAGPDSAAQAAGADPGRPGALPRIVVGRSEPPNRRGDIGKDGEACAGPVGEGWARDLFGRAALAQVSGERGSV